MNAYVSLYPNCSLGGMTTVFRNRALADPQSKHILLFQNDFQGGESYRSVSNLDFKIIGKGRFQAYAQYAIASVQPVEVRITSLPSMAEKVRGVFGGKVVYEFHSSDLGVLSNEVDSLDFESVDVIAVPSVYLSEMITQLIPSAYQSMIEVRPNLVDLEAFNSYIDPARLNLNENCRPLVWVGRFDKGKNYRDLLRILSSVDQSYSAIVVVSMEKQPERLADFLSEAEQYRISDRVYVLTNITPKNVGSIYTYAARRGGFFCSTSLGESYGYGVAEAAACGLRVLAYDVGAIPERAHESSLIRTIPVGSLTGFIQELNQATSEREQLGL